MRTQKDSHGSAQHVRSPLLSQWWFPFLVLVVSLASTFFLWHLIDRGRIERAEQLFERQAEEITSRIIKRLHDHEQVLLGANALFHVRGDAVTRNDWRHYVSALNLGENHPGILGLGYTVWLPAAEKASHIRGIRGEGFPEYVIRPAGERPSYTAIIWLEPFDWRNQRAFGYDMYTEPVRREAMAEARDTGKTTVAARVLLVQETKRDQQSGMLMYVPSYRQGLPIDTVAERRRALRGFVYSPIRMDDFVRGTLSTLPTDIDFEIHAGEARTKDTLMFSAALAQKRPLPEGDRPVFSSTRTVRAYGVHWIFTFRTLRAFHKELSQSKSLATLLTGILSSVLLSTLAFLQARSRRQALAIADERLQSATRIRETMERLKLATDVAGVGIWTWDFRDDRLEWDDRLREWYENPPPSDLSWEFWRSRVHPDDLERTESALREARLKNGPWEGEFRIILSGDRILHIRAASVIERDDSGNPCGMVGINYDITRQRVLEESLRQAKEGAEEASRAKSEFLANMSHEIRTPMTVFLAALEHLQELDKDPDRLQMLQMADTSAERLRSLIEDILDFSKIEARKVELHEEPVTLRVCVQEAVSLLSLAAGEKGLALNLDIAPDAPETIVTDPDRLSQVLVNLVGNAVKFTDRGRVDVRVVREGKDLLFRVRDTGPGIPEEKQSLLFHSFSQVDSSRTRRHGGTGLGLAISKGLVTLMGGEIRVRSAPGEGSTFSFTLPLKTPAPSPRPAAVAEEDLPIPEGKARILLAEDDPAVREMIQMVVRRHGYRVEAVEDGEEAIRRWREGDFDLILMDVQMPHVDGVKAAKAIRDLERETGRKSTCIIALTAHARPDIEEECREAGMDTFLTKPVSTRTLYQAMEECLEER